MGALGQMLNQTEETVLQVQELDSAARTKLDSVISDTRKLEGTVQELLAQVEFMKNSDIRGESPLGPPPEGGATSVPVAPPTCSFSLLQGRRTASQSTSCSPGPLALTPTPPPWTPAAPWRPPETYGSWQRTK